jgi:hypothetical protein
LGLRIARVARRDRDHHECPFHLFPLLFDLNDVTTHAAARRPPGGGRRALKRMRRGEVAGWDARRMSSGWRCRPEPTDRRSGLDAGRANKARFAR